MYRLRVRQHQRGEVDLSTMGPNWIYEVPEPIQVGQVVTAYHKTAKLLQRGHILTADYERGTFRVQFERGELGCTVCEDTDIAVHGVPPTMLYKPGHSNFQSGIFTAPDPDWVVPVQAPEEGSPRTRLSSAHPQDFRWTLIPLMIQLVKLLDRKEEILQAFAQLNDEAEESEQRTFSKQKRQEYAWLIVSMERNNEALSQVIMSLRRLSDMEASRTAEDEDGGSRRGSTVVAESLSPDPTDMMWIRRVMENLSTSSRLIVAHAKAFIRELHAQESEDDTESREPVPAEPNAPAGEDTHQHADDGVGQGTGGREAARPAPSPANGATRASTPAGAPIPGCNWTAPLAPADPTTLHPEVEELVESCVSLLLMLRYCAEDSSMSAVQIDATAADALHRAAPVWRHKVPDPAYDPLAAQGLAEAGAVINPLSGLVEEIYESIALLTSEIRASSLR